MEDKKYIKYIAKRIRELRGELTQKEFAKKVDPLSQQREISKWESGKHWISLRNLFRIAIAFEKDLSHFDPRHKDIEIEIDEKGVLFLLDSILSHLDNLDSATRAKFYKTLKDKINE